MTARHYTTTVPADLMPEVAGLSMGGCVNGGRRFRRTAHAHNIPGRPAFGWICFLSADIERVFRDGVPTASMWHEYAHIRTPGHGHDAAWMRQMIALGRVVPFYYERKAPTAWREVFGRRRTPSQVLRAYAEAGAA